MAYRDKSMTSSLRELAMAFLIRSRGVNPDEKDPFLSSRGVRLSRGEAKKALWGESGFHRRLGPEKLGMELMYDGRRSMTINYGVQP